MDVCKETLIHFVENSHCYYNCLGISDSNPDVWKERLESVLKDIEQRQKWSDYNGWESLERMEDLVCQVANGYGLKGSELAEYLSEGAEEMRVHILNAKGPYSSTVETYM